MIKKNTAKAELSPINSGLRIAVVVSSYHREQTESMALACRQFLEDAGVKPDNIDLFYAPGSWEIPLLVQQAAKSGYNGIAAFGVIVKGETYHFEMIANEVARALMQLSIDYSIPVALEVLAVYSTEQARVRSGGDHNKGIEAAEALLLQIHELARLRDKSS